MKYSGAIWFTAGVVAGCSRPAPAPPLNQPKVYVVTTQQDGSTDYSDATTVFRDARLGDGKALARVDEWLSGDDVLATISVLQQGPVEIATRLTSSLESLATHKNQRVRAELADAVVRLNLPVASSVVSRVSPSLTEDQRESLAVKLCDAGSLEYCDVKRRFQDGTCDRARKMGGLGIVLDEDSDEGDRTAGTSLIAVAFVCPLSPAAASGIMAGDVVEKLNDVDLRRRNQFLNEMSVAVQHLPLTLTVARGERRVELVLRDKAWK